MSAYVSLGVELTQVESFPIVNPNTGETVIRLMGSVGNYPAFGMHMSPDDARKLAAELIEAAGGEA